MEDFRDYLEAVCQAPRLRGTCRTYVETEVVDRLRLSSTEEEFDPFGDFAMDLMVQNVVPEEKPAPEEKPEREEKPKEKIERLPVLEGICKYAASHVLLVGRPGSGKTTALERLLVQEAEAAREDITTRIPVLIRLRDLRSTVLEQIQKELQAQGLRLATEKIADLLWAGRFLVLLDGVNELPNGEMRREVESFRREYQRTTPMIFTTRELNVGLDLGIEKKLEMQPLNERQMQEFTCRYLGQEQGQQLIKGLGQRLREFGETPLLLWMLCGVFRAVGEIPTNLGGVFRGFANIYNKNRFESQKSSEYSRFLQQLAWAMMPQNDPQGLRLSIPRSEAEEIFREFRKAEQERNALSGAIATLDELLRFHLLRPKDDQEVEFSHQLFQEYYAGEYLLSRLPKLGDLELQKYYLNYLDWTEAVALMAGLVGDRSQAVWLVNLGLEVDLMLGARLAGEVLPQFQEETVGLVTNWDLPLWLKVELWGKTKCDRAVDNLTKALQDQNSYVRRKAAEALGNIGGDRAVDPLIKALQDQDRDVRSKAVEVLGNIGSDRTVGSLILALQDQDSDIHRKAAEALGKIGSDWAVASLNKALQDQDRDVRSKAVEVLGNIGSDRTVGSLILALQDQDLDIHRKAAEALGKIGSDWAVASLNKALQDQDRDVRNNAVEVLGKIGGEQAVDSLILALQDQDEYVRLKAVEVLGKIGSEQAIDSLILALQDQKMGVQIKAAEALGKIGSEQAVDSLAKALQDRNWFVRSNAVEALGKIGSDQAVDSLIKSLQDQNICVRSTAAKALGKIGSELAVDSLIKSLQDQDSYVRNNAVEALGEIGSDQAVTSLNKALQDQYSYVRSTAAKALGKIGSDQAVASLNKAHQDQNICVRSTAAKALVNIDSDQAVDSLIKSLQDQNSYVRSNAFNALVNIGSDRAVDALIQALLQRYYDDYVRMEAAEALGKIGSDRAVDALIQTLQDKDQEEEVQVRRSVVDALGKIGNERAVDALIQAFRYQHQYYEYYDVSSHAKWVLEKIGSDNLISRLWRICRSGNRKSLDIILKIQERNRLYNYEISQTPLPVIAPPPDSNSSVTINGGTFNDLVLGNQQIDVKGNYIERKTNHNPSKPMTNNPQPNISISGGTFQDFIAAGDKTTTVHGDYIEQQINNGQNPEAADLAKEIDELLTSLEPTIPNLTTPTGQETLKEAALQTLEQKITLKTRLLKALRAGGLKAIEELCNHPAAKIFVAAFSAAFPEKK